MITSNEAYFLGLMYAKGDILTDGDKVQFRINIKYRRPDDEALRKDNIYTKGVYLYGGFGVGKTYFLMTLANYSINKEKSVIFVNSSELYDYMKKNVEKNNDLNSRYVNHALFYKQLLKEKENYNYFKDAFTMENELLNLEINNLEANKEENKSGEIMEVIENASATTMIYETAVEGVNQLSDDAEKIKEKYKLITPVKGTITSHFGCRDTNNPIVSSYHVGLDIAANTGSTIVASHDGEVLEAGTIGTYGKCIMIKQDELITVYAHCSKINVKKGETIKQGEKIGEVGMTGNATGPHVHFEVRYNERYVNPEDII